MHLHQVRFPFEVCSYVVYPLGVMSVPLTVRGKSNASHSRVSSQASFNHSLSRDVSGVLSLGLPRAPGSVVSDWAVASVRSVMWPALRAGCGFPRLPDPKVSCRCSLPCVLHHSSVHSCLTFRASRHMALLLFFVAGVMTRADPHAAEDISGMRSADGLCVVPSQ